MISCLISNTAACTNLIQKHLHFAQTYMILFFIQFEHFNYFPVDNEYINSWSNFFYTQMYVQFEHEKTWDEWERDVRVRLQYRYCFIATTHFFYSRREWRDYFFLNYTHFEIDVFIHLKSFNVVNEFLD